MVQTFDSNTSNMRYQSGYSLVELSIALAIISVILVGSLVGVQKILRTNKVNNQLKTATQVGGSVVSQTLRLADTSTVTTANMSGLGVWPLTKVTNPGLSTAVVLNEFGGREYLNPVTVALDTYAANQTVRYSLTGIPNTACAELAQGLSSVGVAVYVLADTTAAVGSLTAVPAAAATVQAPNASMNISTLGTACSGAGATKSIDVVLARN
jgi:prepilin-type N-terminal cleavage/methylation domain-containing protein